MAFDATKEMGRTRRETVISAPPFQLSYSSSLPASRTPFVFIPEIPRRTSSWSPLSRFAASQENPVLHAINSLRIYLEDVNHSAEVVESMDSWLPITESINGNTLSAVFHVLCSGIGFQTLLLPVAFATLGWTWGVVCLLAAFFWQLYTTWILTRLHESDDQGTRYCRYLHLCSIAFGHKRAMLLAKFPIMYLSGGTCTSLIIIGGGSLKLFYETVCGPTCTAKHLSGAEWYLVFVCVAIIIAQLPNLNSIAGVSLIGGVTAFAYCTIIWAFSVAEERPVGVTHDPGMGRTVVGRILRIMNGVGLIAFVFRGHNLILEIQGTMPSSSKTPSHVPMWRAVKIAYAIIPLCLFPTAIGGYWSYGDLIPRSGILAALHKFHGHSISRAVLGLTTLLVVINCLSSYQIFAVPVFDNLESAYTSKQNRACPRWVRSAIRVFFGSLTFLISLAFPFLPDLGGLLGGIALPVTLAYPCFMWILIKKPKKRSSMWYINWGLGIFGMVLSIVLIACGLWNLIHLRLKVHFFKAQLDSNADYIGSTIRK